MARAEWNGAVLAESDDTIIIEGNHYFPPDSVKWDLFSDNPKSTHCPWKGSASYYDVTVEGEANTAAAWTYRDPKSAAAEIKDYVAFWGGVAVSG